jgi:hypothetical protein
MFPACPTTNHGGITEGTAHERKLPAELATRHSKRPLIKNPSEGFLGRVGNMEVSVNIPRNLGGARMSRESLSRQKRAASRNPHATRDRSTSFSNLAARFLNSCHGNMKLRPRGSCGRGLLSQELACPGDTPVKRLAIYGEVGLGGAGCCAERTRSGLRGARHRPQ